MPAAAAASLERLSVLLPELSPACLLVFSSLQMPPRLYYFFKEPDSLARSWRVYDHDCRVDSPAPATCHAYRAPAAATC